MAQPAPHPHTRLIAIAAILAVALLLTLIGDPLLHPGQGVQSTGERGVTGSRVAELAALLIAFIIAWPPREEEGTS